MYGGRPRGQVGRAYRRIGPVIVAALMIANAVWFATQQMPFIGGAAYVAGAMAGFGLALVVLW